MFQKFSKKYELRFDAKKCLPLMMLFMEPSLLLVLVW